MESIPEKYGKYAVRIFGKGQYSGEEFIRIRVDDSQHVSNFYISSADEVSLDEYKTVGDLEKALQVSAYGRDDSDNVLLTQDVDYRILKWGIGSDDVEADENDDASWDEVSTSAQLQDDVYAVKIEPLGSYYGDPVWLCLYVTDLKVLSNYDFEITGRNSPLVIGEDDFDISGLKVQAECEINGETSTLVQGKDFKLGDTWYKETGFSSGEWGYEAIDGNPKDRGFYRIPVIGLGDFGGQTEYVYTYVCDSTKLADYSFSYKQYLVAGSDLAPSKLETKLYQYFYDNGDSLVGRTLVFGTDYTVRWGSYDSNGNFQMLDEGKYPEVSEETTDYYLKVIGLGNFAGQELDPEEVTIHKEECKHANTQPYEKEATCTEDGYENGVECSDCGKIIEEPTVVKALGHNLKEDKSTAKNATCTEDGRTADKYCTRCDYEEEGTVIPKGSGTHSYVTDETDTKSAKDATCTEGGYVPAQVCSACGDKKAGYTTEALGHDYQEVAGTAVAATCSKAGKEADKKCTRCGDEVSGKEIPATGKHTAKVTKAGVAATYTSTGLTEEKVCADCGTVLQEQSVIAKLSAKAQPVSVKTATKSVKKAKVKKKAQVVSGAVKVSGAKGKVTYAKAGGSGKLKINASNGKITVKKKTKKGTYSIKIKVNVAASASGEFNAYTKTVTVKVKVK